MANTLVATILQRAYREGNILAIGASPTINQQNEALDELNSLMWSSLGFEMGEDLYDWQIPSPQRTAPVAANFPQLPFPQNINPEFVDFPSASDPDIDVWQYPPKNSRIVWGGVTSTGFFAEAPEDGSRMALIAGSGAGDGAMNGQVLTLDGNGRTIGGSNTQTYTWPTVPATMWIYHSDTGDWTVWSSVAYGGNMPFPPSTDDFWSLSLAIRLAPRYGKMIQPETAKAFQRADTRFKAQFRQSGTTQYGASDFPRSLQSYISGRLFW